MPASPDTDLNGIAEMLFGLVDVPASCDPVTASDPTFDLECAYQVSALIRERRRQNGETPVGWKIGFTNRTIWDEFGVNAPIWGPVYDNTVAVVDDDAAQCDVSGLSEPKIEPEIVFRLAKTPAPGSDENALLDCIDGVALGFELVQSPFPGWRFQAPDTVAAFGLHGLLRHKPFTYIEPGSRDDWRLALGNFSITLRRDGSDVDRGVSENVLGGPLSALKAFVDGLPQTALGPSLLPGDVVTTGTVTRAFDIKPGEAWSARIDGLPLSEMSLRVI